MTNRRRPRSPFRCTVARARRPTLRRVGARAGSRADLPSRGVRLLLLLAAGALVAALAPAGLGAQAPSTERYEARLAGPAPAATVTVGGVEWSCESVSCWTESSQSLANVKMCRGLAAELGRRIVALGPSGGRGLDAATLDICNEVVARGDEADGREPRGGGDADERKVVTRPVTQQGGDMVRADPREVAGAADPAPFVYYKIRNRNSGKVLAVSGGHVRNGASAIQWADQGQPDVLWRPIPAGDGVFKLKNRNSGRFLAVSGGKRDNGQNVLQWDDDDQGDVHWRFEPAGGPWLKIRNAATGKYLVVPEGMTRNGANIVQWEELDRHHAQWRLQPAADIRRECEADRNIARRVGPDTRPDLEVQDLQVKDVKVHEGSVVLLRVEALLRNRSAGAWSGRGTWAVVHENGGNHLIKPGSVGAMLPSRIGPGETVRLSDVFVRPREQESEVTFGRVMKAALSGGMSEAGNAVQAMRERYLDDDGEPTRHLRQLMEEGAGVPSNLLPLFSTGQRQTLQVQLEPVEDRGGGWRDDLRLCNNFLQLSFVVDGRGVAKGFRTTQKGPGSYEAFHRHTVPVSRD